MSVSLRSIRQHPTVVVAMAFLVMCLGVGVLCFQYYRGLQHTILDESRDYLRELAVQAAGNAGRTIADNFAVLGTISSVLRTANIQTFEALQPEVRAQQSFWNYKDVLLIDSKGTAYDAFGNTVALGGGDYLREAVALRRRSMSSSQVINGTECMVFVIPISGISINGTEMSALAATHDLATFDRILSINSFGGKAYAHIIKRDGSVVIRSSSNYAPQSGYNILSTLTSAKLGNGMTLDRIRNDILGGNSGVVSFTQDGRRMYMAYVPLDSKEWYLLGFVPTEVVNANSELLMNTTFLLCAAITLGFSILVAFLLLTFSRHKQKLEQIAYVDPVTSGNTIERFYELSESLLATPGRPLYALVYANVEKFKLLNEEFGRRACDDMLRCIYEGIQEHLSDRECIGRLFADNYCILITYTNEEALPERFNAWYEASAQRQNDMGGVWLAPIMEFGVYVISNDSLPFPHMIDRAKLALRETSTELQGRLRYTVYDDAIRRQLFRERHLESMMGTALENRHFQVYLQPKYRAETETIGGAEALVRWISSEGVIYPDEFITLFEKNGFIVQLDLWVFDEVCRRIRGWLDEGLRPMKVSVNCSRVQLRNPRFLDRYVEICTQNRVPPEFIEIELTENVVFEDVATLGRLIDDIHAQGFGCSMDDFGSGYSSLNLIQDIPVDTIKLDKIFFHKGERDLDRTESVVGSILTMSRSLSMTTVAEGVEERVQVDMLKRLGCDFIQGYYFSKPLPIPDFERLAFGRTVELVIPGVKDDEAVEEAEDDVKVEVCS